MSMSSSAMAHVKTLTLGALAGVGLYLLFLYAGNFSQRQSLVLALVLIFVVDQLHGVTKLLLNKPHFTPFCVSVVPKWRPLLSDLKLLNSDDEWKRFNDACQGSPASGYKACGGFMFTVIGQHSGFELPGLTYWNDHKVFTNGLEFSESIIAKENDLELGGLEEEHPFFSCPKWSDLPRVFLQPGIHGYELGLEVQSDWWKDLCNRGETGTLAKIDRDTNELCGTTKLALATLPYSAFVEYLGAPTGYKRELQQANARDRALTDSGWKWKDPLEDYDPSIAQDPWMRLDHNYFHIAHRAI